MTWYENAHAPWTQVSSKLIPARLLTLWLVMAVPFIAGALGGAMTGIEWLYLVSAFALVAGVWGSWVVVRQTTVHAWAEGEEDLMVRRGRMFRSVTVVPYGRMQFVDVTAGPIDRAFGIATVQLHTASPGTDASIAGVPAAEAARLRDRLTSRGEARLAGL